MLDISLQTVILMIMLSFFGVVVMFLFIMRSLSVQGAAIRILREQQVAIAANLEKQLLEVSVGVNQCCRSQSSSSETTQTDIGTLLHNAAVTGGLASLQSEVDIVAESVTEPIIATTSDREVSEVEVEKTIEANVSSASANEANTKNECEGADTSHSIDIHLPFLSFDATENEQRVVHTRSASLPELLDLELSPAGKEKHTHDKQVQTTGTNVLDIKLD